MRNNGHYYYLFYLYELVEITVCDVQHKYLTIITQKTMGTIRNNIGRNNFENKLTIFRIIYIRTTVQYIYNCQLILSVFMAFNIYIYFV